MVHVLFMIVITREKSNLKNNWHVPKTFLYWKTDEDLLAFQSHFLGILIARGEANKHVNEFSFVQ